MPSPRKRPLPPRVDIVQSKLDRFPKPRYLEIGVHSGTVLLNVTAHAKTGVDPEPRIRPRQLLIRPRSALSLRLVRMKSDDYFAGLQRDVSFDVVFVDGHHTHEQALRDTNNALRHLSPGGTILLHDCNPTSAAAAATEPSAGAGGWCGDVWKAIVELRATRPELSVKVLDTDFGVGVVRRKEGGGSQDSASPPPELNSDDVARLEYANLESDRARLLGLRPP